jgi:hypothetical protein
VTAGPPKGGTSILTGGEQWQAQAVRKDRAEHDHGVLA